MILLVNVDRHFKMLPTYYLYFNCSKFPKKALELEMNKKTSYKAWENKSRKGNIDIKDAKCKTRGASKAREHVDTRDHRTQTT